MLQEAAFRYYWEASGTRSGMAHENLPGDDRIVATGATGLGISALIAAVDRKFITREQGLERLETIVSFLEHAPRYHGAWSHYYDDETGETMSLFGMYDNGGDIIETSYMIQGLLTARGYFNRKQPREQALGKRITALWQAVEWDWFRMTPDSPFLYWHWSPQWGFQIQHPLIGFNENRPDLSLGDRLAHASGAGEHVLQRLGESGQAGAGLSAKAGPAARTASSMPTAIPTSESSSTSVSAPAGRCSSPTTSSWASTPTPCGIATRTRISRTAATSPRSIAPIAPRIPRNSRATGRTPGD